MIAFAVRLVAIAIVFVVVLGLLFLSGRYGGATEEPGRFRHHLVEWG